jgi:hypothetical protein
MESDNEGGNSGSADSVPNAGATVWAAAQKRTQLQWVRASVELRAMSWQRPWHLFSPL